MKKYFLLACSLSLLAGQALADNDYPACQGQIVEPAVQGTYDFGTHEFTITHDSVVTAPGESVPAWTCDKNGILIVVLKFADDYFESRAIAMSSSLMIDFGEVAGDLIYSTDGKAVPLSAAGIMKIMKSDLSQVYSKK